jgi:hypothetical protein
MNALTILALLVLALIGAGCDPGKPTYTGTVAETRGACWTIAGDDKIRYAVKAERNFPIKAGQRVVIRALVAAKQDCAAAVVLDPESVEVR